MKIKAVAILMHDTEGDFLDGVETYGPTGSWENRKKAMEACQKFEWWEPGCKIVDVVISLPTKKGKKR